MSNNPDDDDEDTVDVWLDRLQQCSEPDRTPPLTDEDLKSSIPDILAQLNLKACETTSDTWASLAVASGGTHSTGSGCESVQILASKLLMQTRIQSCLLSFIAQNKRTVLKNDQSINLIVEGEFNCPNGLELLNKIDVNVTDKTGATGAMASAMALDLVATIKETFSQTQKQTTGFGATVTGQRLLSDVATALSVDLSPQVISEMISDILNKALVAQQLNVFVGPNGRITTAQGCKVTNDIVVRFASESIVASAIAATLDIKAVTDYFKELETYQENVSKGLSLGFPLMGLILAGIVLIAVVIFGTFKYGAGGAVKILESKTMKAAVICGTIIAVVVIAVGGAVAIIKAKTDVRNRELDLLYNNPDVPGDAEDAEDKETDDQETGPDM